MIAGNNLSKKAIRRDGLFASCDFAKICPEPIPKTLVNRSQLCHHVDLMAKFKLIVDSDQNPLNLVLGNWDVVDSYARYVMTKFGQWESMKPPDRAKFLTDFPQHVLDDLSIPPPTFLGFTQHMGAFERKGWRILLSRPLLADSGADSVAEQAGHVIHEYEHLGCVFVACRYLAAKLAGDAKSDSSAANAHSAIQSQLGVMKEIAQVAFADPLPSDLAELGSACLFRATSEKGTGDKPGYYESLQANIRKSEAEVDMASREIAKLEQAGSSKDVLFDAFTREHGAKRSLKRALREYDLSETEIGSNAVEGQVNSRIRQLISAGR